MNPLKINFCLKTLLLPLLFVLATIVHGQDAGSPEARRTWEKIAPYFSPPEEFEAKYGEYRSPLKFYDGRKVETPRDWKKRRKEILDRWNGLMGRWPPLLEHQELNIISTTREEGYTLHRVRFNWLPEESTEGYLLIPDGEDKKPAVISVYYEPETAIGQGKPHRDYALQLAERGFVTLSLGTTEASEKKTYALYYPGIKKASVQPLSMLAYAAANAWHVLSKVPGVDPSRIGIIGHSFGGKWAMFASCLFDRFACAVWSDPGIVFEKDRPMINYWEPWYLGYHPPPWRDRGLPAKENPVKGLYKKLLAEGYDLHELHALMAPRPFLVSGGSEDPPERWIPLSHTLAVNRLLGFNSRLAMTNRPDHSPNAQSNEAAYLFFEYFLMHNGISQKR